MSEHATMISEMQLPPLTAERPPRVGPPDDFVPFDKSAVERSLSDRFEQQVARHPHRVAVRTQTHTLTYERLNAEAHRLAHTLLLSRDDGAGAARPVALLLEKGTAILAATLGVLKTGRPQVFLDPLFPPARNAALLEDSEAGLVITNHQHLPLARELAGPTGDVLNIDEIDPQLPAGKRGRPVAPETLAYILYTSGSTGTPKGVLIEHRTLLHRVMRQTNSFRLSAADRLSHLASFGTGQGLVNIFCALLNGAGLYPLDIKAEGLGALAAWLAEEEITIYRSSASVFRHFIGTLAPGQKRFSKVRLVRLASEQVTARDIELCKEHFAPDCVFVNGLSTSETGIIREHFMNRETPTSGSHVPVGRAVEDMEVQLLGEDGAEVAPGETGEIAVRSRYLSPGYWRNPALTRKVFLPDPQGGEKRIYLTGDLGRMLPGDLLVHLGRKDFQVKIRGNRVEVVEIELALLAHAAVREAVVIARRDARGEESLVAYLVPGPGAETAGDALRLFLRKSFPDHMIPSAFVFLDALPLLSSGKVDRQALAARPLAPLPAREDEDAPQTATEEVLARIWSQVLALAEIGRNADFFLLGGHSLLATQVILKINSTFQIQLPLVSLFASPTVAGMATLVEEEILGELEALSEEEARQLIASPHSS